MYTPTIGLEVHAELKTRSKMFCGCPNSPHGSQPNQNICPVCMAHPGTLPVANMEAVKKVIIFGTAVGGQIATYSEFDRKNYFYPDIPKAYQISQYTFPFVVGGSLAGVALTRVHLEEDTARSQHDKGDKSLIDFNRAGVPLMELVTEPVIHDAKTAGDFARELQLTLRSLGISDANMEKGEMRVEANISVSKTGELGTKVEVKNLNSFKSVEGAITYEIERQIATLEKGETLIQETRGWDEVKSKTVSQRSKESAKDYRYFPDPDLPPLDVLNYSELLVSRLDDIFNELPEKKRSKYKDIGLTNNVIETILNDKTLDVYFSNICKQTAVSAPILALSANYLVNDLLPLITTADDSDVVLSPVHFVMLMTMIHEKKLATRAAKDVLIAIALADTDPGVYATEHNLLLTTNAADVAALVAQVVAGNEAVVAEYQSGKVAAFQFLLGHAMKLSRGAMDPKVITEALKKAIE